MKLILAFERGPVVVSCSSLPSQVADNGSRMVCDKEQMGRIQARSQSQSVAHGRHLNAFNKDYTAYGECMKKYIDDTKLILNAAATAVNGVVEEFNKFAADIKAQDEASKN